MMGIIFQNVIIFCVCVFSVVDSQTPYEGCKTSLPKLPLYKAFCANTNRPIANPHEFRGTTSLVMYNTLYFIDKRYNDVDLLSHFVTPHTFSFSLLDFNNSCNYFNPAGVGCASDYCSDVDYRAIATSGGVFCVVYHDVFVTEFTYQNVFIYLHEGTYFSSVVPISYFDYNRMVVSSVFFERNFVRASFGEAALYHIYFRFLNLYYPVQTTFIKCGLNSGVLFNVNYLVNSTCIFTVNFQNQLVCAASFAGLSCQVTSSLVPVHIFPFAIFDSKARYLSVSKFNETMSNLTKSIDTISSAMVKVFSGLNVTMGSVLNSSDFSSAINLDNITVAISNLSLALVGSLDGYKTQWGKDMAIMEKFLGNVANYLDLLFKAFDIFKGNFRSGMQEQLKIFSRTFKDGKITINQFSSLVKVLNSTAGIVTLNQTSLEQLWRTYFYLLTKDDSFMREDINNVGSIFSWLVDVLSALFKPFFEVLISFIGEIVMAFVEFILDFEPLVEKILTTLEAAFEKLVGALFRILVFIINLIKRLVFFVDQRFHLFEYVLFYAFIYFFVFENHFICIFCIVFVIFLFGSSRYFPSLLTALDNLCTAFQKFLHNLIAFNFTVRNNGTHWLVNSTLGFYTLANHSFIHELVDPLLDIVQKYSVNIPRYP